MATQWHSMFDAALRADDVIAIWVVLERHLNRPATAVELSRAQRSAIRYAQASNTQIVRVMDGREREAPHLLLARADADLTDTDRLHHIATGQPLPPRHQGRRTRNVSQRAEALTTTITKAAKTARLLNAGQLTPTHAAALSAEIAAALPALVDLQQRLHLRGGITTSFDGSPPSHT